MFWIFRSKFVFVLVSRLSGREENVQVSDSYSKTCSIISGARVLNSRKIQDRIYNRNSRSYSILFLGSGKYFNDLLTPERMLY